MISTYSNVHRAFVQSCILHGVLKADDALKILTHLYAKFQPDEPAPTEERLKILVEEINVRLERFEHKIVELDYDPTLVTYYIFVNLSDTPVDRFQTAYPETELSFFRLILHELTKAESHRVGQIDCLNLTTKTESGKHVTKARAEVLIAEWQALGYLVLEEDEVGFGPKAMVEFDRYLLNNFPDNVQKCRLCKEVLFYGVQCNKCLEVLHKVCLKKYLSRMKKCPACKHAWTGPKI